MADFPEKNEGNLAFLILKYRILAVQSHYSSRQRLSLSLYGVDVIVDSGKYGGVSGSP